MLQYLSKLQWPLIVVAFALVAATDTGKAQNGPAPRDVGAIVVSGNFVQILDGDGNLYQTTDTRVVFRRTPIGNVFTVVLQGVPNSTGRRVVWSGENTGSTILIRGYSLAPAAWRLFINPNGNAVLMVSNGSQPWID